MGASAGVISEDAVWITLAFASAFFAGTSSIFAKKISADADTDVSTGIRSVVILALMCVASAIGGGAVPLSEIPAYTLFFVILSGLCLGIAWLIFFRALSVGDANKVVPVDRTSTVMAMLMSFIFLAESVNVFSVCAMLFIIIGTALMIHAGLEDRSAGKKWLVLALLSAFFTALSAVLGKPGADAIDPVYATAIRSLMFFLVAWAVVALMRKGGRLRSISGRDWRFIMLSGLATGMSWMCFYAALSSGPASIVTPIDKLSTVVAVVLAYTFLHEGMDRKSVAGLVAVTAGTLLLLFAV